MEVKVKGVTEAKATLPEKQATQEKYQELQTEVQAKQTAFDRLSDQTQFLLQSSTDSRTTSQLTQINSRYTSLLTFTKVGLVSLIIFFTHLN